MEPEGSIPYSQEPSTGPSPEPYKSNPHHPIMPLLGPIWYIPPTYVLVFPVVSFLLAFLTLQKFKYKVINTVLYLRFPETLIVWIFIYLHYMLVC
jgi:hypothetical protein